MNLGRYSRRSWRGKEIPGAWAPLVVLLIVIAIAALLYVAWPRPAVAQEKPEPSFDRPAIRAAAQPPAVDPTENVKALTAAGLKTAEELRIALKELLQSKLDGAAALSEMRDKAAAELLQTELKRIDQVDKLRADLTDKFTAAERDRINAIRLVDVSAAADLQRRTSEAAAALQARTDTLATDLRTQTALLAENLRTLVLNTAAQHAAAQKQAADEISKHLSTIDTALSEGRGKQTVSDPALSNLVEEVRKLSQRNADLAGVGQGRSDVVGWIVAGIMMLVALGGLALGLINRRHPA